MLLPSSLNTINLEVYPDKLLLLYPASLLLIWGLSLYLTDIAWWVKLILLVVAFIASVSLSLRYILLLRARSVIKIEYTGRWFLHYQDGSIREAELSRNTVYSSFMLFLSYRADNKNEYIVVRRSCVDAAQYDALYVYLSRIWRLHETS